MLEETRVSGAEATNDFFAPLLIADDRLPGWETDGAGMGGIWQRSTEILLQPSGVCQEITHGC
jgi:hypothetical protein